MHVPPSLTGDDWDEYAGRFVQETSIHGPPPLTGAFAGLAVTLPMTLAMEALHRQLPWTERQPLPPRTITMRTAARAGIGCHLDGEGERTRATLVGHFGYGALAGALFGVPAEAAKLPRIAGGVAFGLVVWLVSYAGWLPMAGLFPPAHEQSPRQNALMIAARVVWSATRGIHYRGIQER